MKLLLPLLLLPITRLWSQSTTSYQTQAQELLETAVAQNKTIGLSAGFAVDGEITWTSAAGWKHLEQKEKMAANTLTRAASIAKPMTAIAIMQLFEQGKIDLDEAIQTYLPDFPKKKEGTITIRQLLTHTSGIKGYAKKESTNYTYYPSLLDATKVFWDRDLHGPPGTAYNYTSYGYVVLGLLIESVSGMSYEEYMQKNIWDKAGMKNTGMERLTESYPNKTALYHQVKKGKIKWVKKSNDLSNRIPAGGFHTTAEDLLKFGNAVLQHDLIKESSYLLMLENPGIRKSINGYGFGWSLYGNNPTHGMVFGHDGGQFGCSSQLMILPEIKTAIIVLGNTSGTGSTIPTIAVKLFDIAAAAKK